MHDERAIFTFSSLPYNAAIQGRKSSGPLCAAVDKSGASIARRAGTASRRQLIRRKVVPNSALRATTTNNTFNYTTGGSDSGPVVAWSCVRGAWRLSWRSPISCPPFRSSGGRSAVHVRSRGSAGLRRARGGVKTCRPPAVWRGRGVPGVNYARIGLSDRPPPPLTHCLSQLIKVTCHFCHSASYCTRQTKFRPMMINGHPAQLMVF